MSTFVTNDLHGSKTLTEKVINTIKAIEAGDTLIINGDGAGARGPIMNKLVKIFYEVRRGETDYECLISALSDIIGERPDVPTSWVYDSVHAGVFRAVMSKHYKSFRQCVENEILQTLEETIQPLAQAAKDSGINIIYSPGNGEIVPSDFSVKDITIEETLPPEERFYQKLQKEGYFERFGIQYVPYAHSHNGVVIIGTNLLDVKTAKALELLSSQGLLDENDSPKAIVCHYPPGISPLGKIFGFWSPNKVDRARTKALDKIVQELRLDNNVPVFFGHIHLGPDDPGMMAYPPILGFQFSNRYGFWIKPGEIIKI